MSSLTKIESEILKFEKKGFKKSQKKTLKNGTRIVLLKKGGFLGTDNAVYFYYVDGNADTNSLREAFKDFEKYYNDYNFDNQDKGFFLTSGSADEKLFRDLRQAMIKDSDIRNSIKLISSGKSAREETKIETPKREAKRETKKEQREKTNLSKVVSAIEGMSFVRSEKEKDYETQVYQTLCAKGFDVEYEKARKGARFDLVVGNDEIAIEMKVIKNASPFYGLVGQIKHYQKQFDNIIVLLIDEWRNPSVMKQEIKIIKELDPEKIIVIKK